MLFMSSFDAESVSPVSGSLLRCFSATFNSAESFFDFYKSQNKFFFLLNTVSIITTFVKLTPKRPLHHNQKINNVTGGLTFCAGETYNIIAIICRIKRAPVRIIIAINYVRNGLYIYI